VGADKLEEDEEGDEEEDQKEENNTGGCSDIEQVVSLCSLYREMMDFFTLDTIAWN